MRNALLLFHHGFRIEFSGEPIDLGKDVAEIPDEWQSWIESQTGGAPGYYSGLNPYNSGITDLRNSLGHFNVSVFSTHGVTRRYLMSDFYQFGFVPDDVKQTARHGFPIDSFGAAGQDRIQKLVSYLSEKEYVNPGGFTERFEVKKVSGEMILYVPQAVLASKGVPFTVRGWFSR